MLQVERNEDPEINSKASLSKGAGKLAEEWFQYEKKSEVIEEFRSLYKKQKTYED